MHIPPYHKKASWQRFFVGAMIGAVIAYCIVMYMYGTMYEQLIEENQQLHSQVTDLKNHNEALLKDKKDLDEKSNEPITVESIEIEIINDKEVDLDSLMKNDLEELIKEEINQVVGQELSVISKSASLLRSTIENKKITIDEFSYTFHVKTLTITETVTLEIEAEVSN